MTILIRSDRIFKLWRATVGHSQLLLRSPKTSILETRVDVYFKPVEALKIRTTMQGLFVRDADADESAAVLKDCALVPTEGMNVYVVESKAFRGYVVAGVAAISEDTREFDEPSALYVGQSGL